MPSRRTRGLSKASLTRHRRLSSASARTRVRRRQRPRRSRSFRTRSNRGANGTAATRRKRARGRLQTHARAANEQAARTSARPQKRRSRAPLPLRPRDRNSPQAGARSRSSATSASTRRVACWRPLIVGPASGQVAFAATAAFGGRAAAVVAGDIDIAGGGQRQQRAVGSGKCFRIPRIREPRSGLLLVVRCGRLLNHLGDARIRRRAEAGGLHWMSSLRKSCVVTRMPPYQRYSQVSGPLASFVWGFELWSPRCHDGRGRAKRHRLHPSRKGMALSRHDTVEDPSTS